MQETTATESETTEAAATAAPEPAQPGRIEAWIDGWLESNLPFYADHTWLQVLTLVGLSIVVASLVSFFLKRVAAGFLKRTETTFDDEILSALTPPIYTAVIAIGFRLAIFRLELSPTATERFADLLTSLVVVVALVAALRISGVVVRALAENHDRISMVSPTTVPLFENLSKIVLVLVAAYLVITIWDGDISGLIAAGGIAGLAIGFAARDTLANIFSGIFIFADGPYKIGDFITLDSGERGMVTDIGLRSTRLLTRDDVEITIPNAVMGAAKIVNESGGPHTKYRIRVKIGVAYGSKLEQVEEILLGIADGHHLVCDDPEPRVRFRTFGASSLDLELLCWVEAPVLRGKALHELNLAVYNALNEAGIEIPYSKHDVYLKEMPAASGLGSRATD